MDDGPRRWSEGTCWRRHRVRPGAPGHRIRWWRECTLKLRGNLGVGWYIVDSEGEWWTAAPRRLRDVLRLETERHRDVRHGCKRAEQHGHLGVGWQHVVSSLHVRPLLAMGSCDGVRRGAQSKCPLRRARVHRRAGHLGVGRNRVAPHGYVRSGPLRARNGLRPGSPGSCAPWRQNLGEPEPGHLVVERRGMDAAGFRPEPRQLIGLEPARVPRRSVRLRTARNQLRWIGIRSLELGRFNLVADGTACSGSASRERHGLCADERPVPGLWRMEPMGDNGRDLGPESREVVVAAFGESTRSGAPCHGV